MSKEVITEYFLHGHDEWDEHDTLVHSYYGATLSDNNGIPKEFQLKKFDTVSIDYGKGIVEVYKESEDGGADKLILKLSFAPQVTDVETANYHG